LVLLDAWQGVPVTVVEGEEKERCDDDGIDFFIVVGVVVDVFRFGGGVEVYNLHSNKYE
jgi:hypothetical protein